MKNMQRACLGLVAGVGLFAATAFGAPAVHASQPNDQNNSCRISGSDNDKNVVCDYSKDNRLITVDVDVGDVNVTAENLVNISKSLNTYIGSLTLINLQLIQAESVEIFNDVLDLNILNGDLILLCQVKVFEFEKDSGDLVNQACCEGHC